MIYGWGERIWKSIALGMMYCPNCCITMHYLARRVFRIHICFIPVFWYTKNYYVVCDKCSRGMEITQDVFKNLKQIHKPFCNKKQLIECFNYIVDLSNNMIYDNSSIEYILDRLKERFPINDPILENQYRSLIESVFKSKQTNFS